MSEISESARRQAEAELNRYVDFIDDEQRGNDRFLGYVMVAVRQTIDGRTWIHSSGTTWRALTRRERKIVGEAAERFFESAKVSPRYRV